MSEGKQYKVGDKVWWAKCGHEQITLECPVCFGKRKVVLILGNDDRAILDCGCCARGFGPSTGTILEWEYVAESRQVIIDRVDIEETSHGEKREYRYNHFCLDADKIFDTKKEADERCKKIIAKLEEEQSTRAMHIKKNQNRSYSWNAGYHIRNAKRDRESADRHERMAVICKAKSRKSKAAGEVLG